jgi:DNA-binding CsgD family transcriptional regulator
MPLPGALDLGRDHYDRREWAAAFAQLAAADRASALEPSDLVQLAKSAFLVGKDGDTVEVLARAHQEFLARGAVAESVRCAFWLFFVLRNQGQHARGSGWFARGRRLLEEHALDCVEQGYLLLPAALEAAGAGDAAAAGAAFDQAASIGVRFGEADLIALARQGVARALIRSGECAKGVELLDEVMVAVTAGEVSPVIVGTVYCSVLAACHEIFDLGRAREWTKALDDWCASQPDLVPYRGECLVHRAEILQLDGEWIDALEQAVRACERLSSPPGQPAAGAAYYQRAEIHRLRGEFAEAEGAYLQASRCGRTPQPGLALLRLAQGQVEGALAASTRLVDESPDRRMRATALAAHVEILLAGRDTVRARAAADELNGIAASLDAPFLRASALHARGAVLLADGDARGSLAALHAASKAWQHLGAPYHEARARLLIGLACRALGDEDGARMECDAARRTFQQLGAVPDLARLNELSTPVATTRDVLTSREIEVIRLIATGKTNKAIAETLDISEKTVARHISNIFTKLDLSSRAAATAYAYEHALVR